MALGRIALERLVAALLAFGSAAPPAEAESFSGFTYCSPPPRPACIERARAEAEMAACDDQMRIYTTMVFKYRECLEREMERAVSDANEAIGAWRCRSDKTKCRN
ncbi:hypothetical protein V3H18_06790 [Methylocystis sp. 9N]|uniref:Uncharacterized protein n=1 Tax=Methylocystis borbori TaxID=3118750 RepID=A0ABU7XFS7_9HYPH